MAFWHAMFTLSCSTFHVGPKCGHTHFSFTTVCCCDVFNGWFNPWCVVLNQKCNQISMYLSVYLYVRECMRVYFIWQGIGYIFILCVLKSFCMHIHIHSFTHSHSTMVFTLLLFPVVVCAFLSRYLNDSTLSKVPCFYSKKSQNEVSDRFALKRALAYSCVHSSLCLHTTFLARMKTI